MFVAAKPTGPAFGRPDDRLRASLDLYAVLYRWDDRGEAFRNNEHRWLWVPAFAGTTKKMAMSLPSLLLIGLEMRVGGAQSRHRHLRGIATRDQIADHVIGFNGCARFDVAEHRRGQLRAFQGKHSERAFQKGRARRIALGGRDRAAFIQRAKDEILAARRGQDIADRRSHQASRGRERGEEHPFLPHLLHDMFAGPRAEFPAPHALGDGTDPIRKLAVAFPEIERLHRIELNDLAMFI